MKKILFVTNHLQHSDGVAKALLNLVNNLDNSKYMITICAMFTIDKNFIKKFNKDVKIFSVFNRYFRGMHKLLKFIPNSIILKRVLKEDYDIVVAYQRGYPTEILSSKYVKIPKIVFMHGYDTNSINYHKKYDKVVCVSQFACDEYKKIVDFPQNITYCHNIIDIQDVINKGKETEDVEHLFKDFKRPILSYVGRLSEEKGLERTLKCLAEIKKAEIDFTYILIGDGVIKSKIENEIENLDLQKCVKMFGFQINPYKFMALSDCYICGSFTEGLSTSCIEASVLGLDVISTDVSGAQEIIYSPDIGMVCENNEEAIVQCLKDYIVNKYPSKFWEDNKSLAKEKWIKEHTLNKFDSIINEVLK